MSADPALRIATPDPTPAGPVEGSATTEAAGRKARAAAPTPPKKRRRFIRSQRFAGGLDVSMATFWRMKAAGKIGPRAIPLSPACLRYDLLEVRAWFDHRKADGSLYTAAEWPAVWAMLRKATNASGRPR